jgi:hypothetical protein
MASLLAHITEERSTTLRPVAHLRPRSAAPVSVRTTQLLPFAHYVRFADWKLTGDRQKYGVRRRYYRRLLRDSGGDLGIDEKTPQLKKRSESRFRDHHVVTKLYRRVTTLYRTDKTFIYFNSLVGGARRNRTDDLFNAIKQVMASHDVSASLVVYHKRLSSRDFWRIWNHSSSQRVSRFLIDFGT